MGQAADFFVSYTSTDRAWAEWIAWQLEAEGYQVVVKAWDFTPGRSWTHEMHQATTTAQRVVAVLSAAYLESEHGEAEWEVFQATDPLGKRGLLLPVRVGEVEPPGLLKTRVYVDLVGRDGASARSALLAAARGARGKPAEEPEFPGAHAQPRLSASEAPRFPGELPPVWNVPFHPNPYFVGRDLLLLELHSMLTRPGLAIRRVALTGLGGVGKTQLAVEYAYRQRADYDLVWWVRGEQPTSLLGDYATLAAQPPLAVALRLSEDAPQATVMAAVRRWLERHHRWLLVIDNAEEPLVVAELLPRSATGHVLVTSQAETGWEPLTDPRPVEALAPAEAINFLLARTKEAGAQAEAAATTLATTLGGLPLALEQAAAYVAASGTVTLTTYVQLFATRALELLTRGQPLGYQHTVATTWSIALQRLQDTTPAAVGLLTLVAFMAPDDLPLPLLASHHAELPEPLASTARDPLALGDAVAALRRYSLVAVTGDALRMHRLVQAVARYQLDANQEQRWAAVALRVLRAALPAKHSNPDAWPAYARLLSHTLAAAGHAQTLGIELEAVGWLLNEAGLYLWQRAAYQQARALFERALALREATLGAEHPDTTWSLTNLALVLRDQGDLDHARVLHERSLAIRRRVLGNNHPDTAWSLNNLAALLADQGDLDQARSLHEQALAIREARLPPDHPDTAQSIHSLGRVLYDQGDLQRARALHERALVMRRRALGDDHPDTAQSIHSLGRVVYDQGNLDEARTLLERALAIRRRILGDDHPHTAHSLDMLAQVLRHQGELERARTLHERARAIRHRALGNDHPATLRSMNNLAETRRALGDLQGAHELHEQTLAARRRVLGEDHPDTLASMKNLAVVRRQLEELYPHLNIRWNEGGQQTGQRGTPDGHPTSDRDGGLYRVKGARVPHAPTRHPASHHNVAAQRPWWTEGTRCCVWHREASFLAYLWQGRTAS